MYRDRVDRELAVRPFRPFIIVLDNGVEVPVTHPENVVVVAHRDFREYHVFSNGERWIFEPVAVGAIHDFPSRRRRRHHR